MRIAYFTLPRTPEYLTATLRDAVDADPTIVPGRDMALFYQAVSPPALPFPEMTTVCGDPDWLKTLVGNPFAATRNYIRALIWAGVDDELAIVSEDDLIYARDWTQRVRLLASEASKLDRHPRSVQRWMISLHHFYNPGEFVNKAVTERGDQLLHWPQTNSFYGSQCMAFPPCVARLLAEAFDAHSREVTTDWHKYYMDMGLKTFCREFGITLYTCHPCLIQHVGEVSVACPNRGTLQNRYFDPRSS